MNAEIENIATLKSPHQEAIQLIFIDGELQTEELNLPAGLELKAENLVENTILINVSNDVVIHQPIIIRYLNTSEEPSERTFKSVIKLGKNAHLTFVQDFVSDTENPYQQQSIIQVNCAEQATLHLVKIQQEGLQATHLSENVIVQAANSVIDSSHYSLGAQHHQEIWQVNLVGQAARCHCRGLTIANNAQRLDTQLTLTHLAQACKSEQVFKSIAADKSRTAFNGKVVVPSSGQKAEAHQLSQNLLLSDRAEINTRPELEIYADDVKCTHGASVGQLDPDALFYLKSRGIDQGQASEMLLNAFIHDQLAEAMPWVQQWIGPLVERKLALINGRQSI